IIDLVDIVLRLGAATLIGAAIGLNRDLHGKPIGVRTLGLVDLASAMATLVVMFHGSGDPRLTDSASRVIQGVLTGIGFLGAGVIIRGGGQVHGLTSAACAWVTACLGLICGMAAWPIVAAGVVLVFVLLVFGAPFEHMMHQRVGGEDSAPADEPHQDASGS